ncbi:uncharacterized protein At5g08430 isoform X2 [Setaria viridis]|uniref:GYF domain-containing protein n=1 Tax=Setaria viridis TaxID=4556 RepID=A0A4U6VCN1_SETVI|nr:uncharacterized protein At5g08430-like isoform X2 [Setaria viridis]TKW27200.1 hypothetical protein SEVIR_3G242700v2 [Setaria viridis]
MGNRARSGRRRRAGGGDGGEASSSKRLRWVAEEEQEEEEEAVDGEDLCFVCKDGGELRVCDFRSCHKAYHPVCVGKDSDFLNSNEEFICEWHTCFICKGRSRYYCYCCPWHTFCQGCVSQAEFVPVLRKTKGFCINCLRMAIMIEKNVDVDSDGERADFNDRATYEFLFKEYWEIVRDKEGMTLDKLEEAYAILKRGQNCKPDPDLEKLPDEERNSDAEFVGHSDDSDEELSSRAKLNGMTMKIKSFRKGAKSMRNGFVGWGSKELIEFLSSIGKDTSETLDQYGVADVVKNYIRQNDLLQKDKKKLVICDEKLQPLFRKSKVRYNKIHYLLERHIAANMILEDEALASSEDNRDSVMTKKARIASYQPSAPKRTPEINKRCFASLVCDNINLIYLRRSLVVHLLKEPDTFESKVIGCFVRIKNDRKDYSFHMHKKLYQLGQVTGIRKTTEEDKIKDISDVLLCIFNMPDISISMLSDEDFDEEECQDLRLLAQNKSFKRYTVGDLEEKARSLRKDIMSHWINRELQRLDRLIDMANEKGWRKAKDEYLDKKQLLRKPSEQQRLLEEVPRVIPEMEDSKDTEVQVTTRDRSTQKSTVAFQGTNGTRASFFKSTAEEKFKGTGGERELSLKSLSEEKSEATNANTDGGTSVTHTQKPGTEANNVCGIPSVQNLDNNAADKGAEVSVDGDTAGAIVQRQSIEATDVITIDDDDDDHPREKSGQATVDLDADDAGDTHHAEHKTNNISRRGHRNVKVKRGASLHMRMWHYIDPQGDEQGPFTMEHLRNWWNNGYFRDDFRVWRTGQTSDTAIKLIDALQLIDEVVAVTGPHVVDD